MVQSFQLLVCCDSEYDTARRGPVTRQIGLSRNGPRPLDEALGNAPTAEAPAMDARIEKNPAARTVANRPRIPSIPVAVEQAGPRAVHCASVTASAPQEL